MRKWPDTLSPGLLKNQSTTLTFQLLLMLASSALHLSFLTFYSIVVDVYWQKVFEMIKSDFFVLFLLKFLYVHSLCFQIYTYSQLAPMFVISGKHFANSKVIAEEKQARKYFYPAQASCPQMLHKDNELWWVKKVTSLKQKWILKCLKSILV